MAGSGIEIALRVCADCGYGLAVGETAKAVPFTPSGAMGYGWPPTMSCTYSRPPRPGSFPENTNFFPSGIQRGAIVVDVVVGRG